MENQQTEEKPKSEEIEEEKESGKMDKSKRNYNYIQLSTRKNLIKLVYKDGLQIKEAASIIGINYSTAKHIIKTFKKTGNIET